MLISQFLFVMKLFLCILCDMMALPPIPNDPYSAAFKAFDLISGYSDIEAFGEYMYELTRKY